MAEKTVCVVKREGGEARTLIERRSQHRSEFGGERWLIVIPSLVEMSHQREAVYATECCRIDAEVCELRCVPSEERIRRTQLGLAGKVDEGWEV